jgi:hypothetical protein
MNQTVYNKSCPVQFLIFYRSNARSLSQTVALTIQYTSFHGSFFFVTIHGSLFSVEVRLFIYLFSVSVLLLLSLQKYEFLMFNIIVDYLSTMSFLIEILFIELVFLTFFNPLHLRHLIHKLDN